MVSSMAAEKEIHMTAEQLKLLLEYLPEGVMLEYLPEGVMLEISWEETDERET